METEWVSARVQLYQLLQAHPEWSLRQFAETLHYSLSWVKKWRRRFRTAGAKSWQMFLSQSRAPKHPARRVTAPVVDAILNLRDTLKTVYQRTVGPETILFHLHRDERLQRSSGSLPRSAHTVWQVLKANGRIPKLLKEHHPLPRPEPMQEWEFDFGLVSLGGDQWLEFLAVLDCGTSILVDTHAASSFQAESALAALAHTLQRNGLPQRLRFDRDSRLVGSWTSDGYPSALIQFLLCLGVEVVVCPPRRPDLKPFVERGIRTLKHECLYPQRPSDLQAGEQQLRDYRHFYNHERPNQALSCGNRPPYEAFGQLTNLPSLPEVIDPNRWLEHYDKRIFHRRVDSSGRIQVDKFSYYLGRHLAGQRVAVHLDAQQRVLHTMHRGQRVKTFPLKGLFPGVMPFQSYLTVMLLEARSIERHLHLKTRRAQT